jgi:quinol-cytochrome oxidoreductase complex cytochrome b subunit
VTEQKSTADNAPRSAAARLFDIRLLIGGLFVVYGIMLTVAGFFTSDKERAKAAGLNINLWLGIGMLIIGAVFLAWFKLRPLRVETDVDTDDRPPDRPTEAAR